MTLRQFLLWAPGSPSRLAVDFPERPFRLWTVYSYTDKDQPPALPLTPQHNQGFFLEDYLHDWEMKPGLLRYFSRVVGEADGVWLLLEWQEPLLPVVNAISGSRRGPVPEVSAKTQTGPRGGVRIPTRIIWRPEGSGLFRMVDSETHEPVLYPWVEWHNGNGRMRYATIKDWNKNK